MKPEQSERILVEELFKKTIHKDLLSDDHVVNVDAQQRGCADQQHADGQHAHGGKGHQPVGAQIVQALAD